MQHTGLHYNHHFDEMQRMHPTQRGACEHVSVYESRVGEERDERISNVPFCDKFRLFACLSAVSHNTKCGLACCSPSATRSQAVGAGIPRRRMWRKVLISASVAWPWRTGSPSLRAKSRTDQHLGKWCLGNWDGRHLSWPQQGDESSLCPKMADGKGGLKAKTRLVLQGFSDPDLLQGSLDTSSPTLART